MVLFGSPVMVALARQLDSAALTQRVIANNVANVNTPNFKKSHVSFQEELRLAFNDKGEAPALATAHPRHLGGAQDIREVYPRVVQDWNTSMMYSQNNVDIDQEMVNLAANTILYDMSASALSSRIGLLSYVIRGGK